MIHTDQQPTDRDQLQCRPTAAALHDDEPRAFGRWLGLINDGR